VRLVERPRVSARVALGFAELERVAHRHGVDVAFFFPLQLAVDLESSLAIRICGRVCDGIALPQLLAVSIGGN
jgi:hypothetical protein